MCIRQLAFILMRDLTILFLAVMCLPSDAQSQITTELEVIFGLKKVWEVHLKLEPEDGKSYNPTGKI